MKLFFTGKRYC